MIPMLTSASYAPRTDVPAWPRNTNSSAIAACTSSATYGVRQRGCRLPNAGGRNRSMPATNGSRAVAANHPPTPPSALIVTSAAASGTTDCRPARIVIVCIACMIPCSPVTCSLGIASRTLNVPAIYKTVMSAPPARIARGNVRRASWISSPIVDPLSTPPNANAMVDQKMTSFSPVLGTNAPGAIGVADPKRVHDTRPRMISSATGNHVATAPTLLSHFPTFNPTTFSQTATARPIIETMMKYALLVESDCHDDPPMNNALPAAKYSTPGKY